MKLQSNTLNLYLAEEKLKYFYDANKMFVELLTTVVCVYLGTLQIQCVRLIHGTTLQTFAGSAVFMAKIVGIFKIKTCRGRKRFNYMDT